MIERKYDPYEYDWCAGEFMVKIYDGIDKWHKTHDPEARVVLFNYLGALQTGLKVLAMDGDITNRERDDIFQYFLALVYSVF